VHIDISPSSFAEPLPSESVDHRLKRPGRSDTAFGVLPLGVRLPCGVVAEDEKAEAEGCEGNLGTDDRSSRPGDECAPLLEESEESSIGLVREGVTGSAMGVLEDFGAAAGGVIVVEGMRKFEKRFSKFVDDDDADASKLRRKASCTRVGDVGGVEA
jgi:hypothetical protein